MKCMSCLTVKIRQITGHVYSTLKTVCGARRVQLFRRLHISIPVVSDIYAHDDLGLVSHASYFIFLIL